MIGIQVLVKVATKARPVSCGLYAAAVAATTVCAFYYYPAQMTFEAYRYRQRLAAVRRLYSSRQYVQTVDQISKIGSDYVPGARPGTYGADLPDGPDVLSVVKFECLYHIAGGVTGQQAILNRLTSIGRHRLMLGVKLLQTNDPAKCLPP